IYSMADRPAVELATLAKLVGGEVVGDATVAIVGSAPLGEVAAGEITFVEQPERLGQATASPAAALVLPRGMHCDSKPVVAVDDVHAAFTKIVLHFKPRQHAALSGVSPHAVVSPTARLGR